MTTETTQPLDYERPDWTPEEMRQTPPFDYATQDDRDLDAHFDREARRVRRQMWVALVVVGVIGAVLVVLA